VAQAASGGVAITVIFKEFGIRLNFTPNVVGGDRVRLKVRPEVSTLDFSNAITLEGFRIPALSTRRTETELELRNGQTFAIAGLLNNTTTQTLSKIPGIGDIPILGLLFKSKAAQKQQTELVVMITPEILPQNSTGVTNELPRQQEPYLTPMNPERTFPAPPPAFPKQGSNDDAVARPVRGAPSTAVVNQPVPAPQPTPAQAVDVLKGQAPKAPTMITEAELKAPGAPGVAAPAAPAAPGALSAPAAPGAPGAPGVAAPAAPGAPGSGAPAERPLTKDEEKRLEKAREKERKEQARQAGEAYRAAQEEQKRQEKLAREQAKRDAEAAEKAAKEAAKEAERQAEADKKRQKTLDEAAKRLKDAEAAYQAELTKKSGS
jgi:hypothetical protein